MTVSTNDTRFIWMYKPCFAALMCLTILAAAGCSGDSSEPVSSSETTGASDSPKPAAKPEEPAAPATTPDSPTDTASTEEPPAQPAAAPASDKKPVEPGATGNFSGTIVLDGAAPDLPPLVKAGDETTKDKEVCGVADVPDQSLLVGEGGGIANVFVYLRRAPSGYKDDPPAEPVILDQKGCVFLPHVALIRTGQKVLVKSSDAVQHNVHTFPGRNQGTNLLINPNDQTGVELAYSRAETDPLQVKCDIHAWMSSYHLVLDHPFMTVTDENGKFSVEGLPAGDYEFRIWHERGGLLDKGYKVTVTGEDEAVTIKFAADKFPAQG